MTIRHLKIFKAVCDNEGITSAAERLNITQPTVSIAIKELEAFYNTKLFDRINRKIYLTEAGEILRQYVDSILEQCEEATEILRNGKLFSKCRLGVNVSFAETHLPRLVALIKVAFSECDLKVFVQNNERLEAMLSSNKIDFAVYDGISERNSKHIEFLFREKMVLLVSDALYNKSNITMEELSRQPLLMREEGSGVRNCVDKAFQSHSFTQTILMESSSTMSLLNLAKQGCGFVFVPRSLAEMQSKELNLVEIIDEILTRTYYLAYNEKKHLTKTMVKLKELILTIKENKCITVL